MQGDLSVHGGITYQAVDDQRSKCSLCQRVIYKLLQKAHTTSHGTQFKAPQAEDKPSSSSSASSFKGIKKISLQFESTPSEPIKKFSIDKPESLLNFEHILKNPVPITLPQKHRSESQSKPCEKRFKSNYSFYIKQSKQCQNSLVRVCFAYERCCYALKVRQYRKWKKFVRDFHLKECI